MPTPSIWRHLDDIIELVAHQPLGLMSDFDGVISEIAPTPSEARLHPGCAKHLATLTQKLPLVAIVSGRSVRQLVDMTNIDGVVYYGVHGMERWTGGGVALAPGAEIYRERLQALVMEIGQRLPSGVTIEEKGLAISFHYRQARDADSARKAILTAIKPALGSLKLGEGKMVVEVRAPIAVNKGTAVAWLAGDYGLRSAIFVGDDRTDLDAFAALEELAQRTAMRIARIAVAGPEASSDIINAADYYIGGVSEVALFYAWLGETLGA